MARIAPDKLDALIAAIWGVDAAEAPAAVDPETRAAQNHALGLAIKAYLQSYLDDRQGSPHDAEGDL